MFLRSLLFMALVLVTGSLARASLIVNSVDFDNITNLATPNEAGLISADIVGDTTDLSKVLFIIRLADDGDPANNPRITDVFFEDGALASILSLGDVDDFISFAGFVEDLGVDFSTPGNQTNLPGANNATPAFVAGADFTADPDTPQPNAKSINEGEYLGVLFALDAGKTYLDLISEMVAGQSRIGVHVQSIPAGAGSDSFVSNPPVTIDAIATPEPASFVIWGGGLLFVALGSRMFGRKAKK